MDIIKQDGKKKVFILKDGSQVPFDEQKKEVKKEVKKPFFKKDEKLEKDDLKDEKQI